MDGYSCSLVCLLLFAFFAGGKGQRAEVNPCRSGLPCDDGQCISREEWCDNDRNCRDGSDEKYCGKIGWFNSVPTSHTCTEKHFACRNGPCIPAVAKCDSFDDCRDYSDEEFCEEELPFISSEVENITKSEDPGSTTASTVSITACPLPKETSTISETGLIEKETIVDNTTSEQQELTTMLKTTCETAMDFRRKEHELTIIHKNKEHELSMQHKREEHELVMQHKREEHEFAMQRKREEHELVIQQKREHDLIMHHKKKEHELSMEIKRKEHELTLQYKREEQELTKQHKRELELPFTIPPFKHKGMSV